jgi:putative transposase
MKPYSLDLRQKIIDIQEREGISQRGLAQRFGVALSFIQKLLKRYRETGSLSPQVRSQQTPTKLNANQLLVLQELVEKHNDATLKELQALLLQETNVKVSQSTIHRMLKKLNITLKKRPFTPMKRKPSEFRPSDLNFRH